MDEARLKEIETFLYHFGKYHAEIGHYHLESAEARDKIKSAGGYLNQLIAALRAAWRERDYADHNRDAALDRAKYHDTIMADVGRDLNYEKDRAARAEAEVERLKHPTVTVSWKGGQETFPLDKVVFHIERLQAVRDAAEAGDIWLRVRHPDPNGQILVNVAWFNQLRRALDACAAQDPAR